MNQGERLVRRKCIKCGERIRVKQIYNPHYSDWEDIEPWICNKCGKGAENDSKRIWREWKNDIYHTVQRRRNSND